MSKQDNLTDFLTDVADAIREKKGTTEKINPQNFSEEIRGIESGGEFNAEIEFADESVFGMNGWKNVVIKEGVKTISQYAFYYSTSLTEISLPESLETIGGYSFLGTKITSVNIPDNVTSILRYSFATCISLHQANIPSNIQNIGNSAFSGDYNIRNAMVFKNKGALTIEGNAFKGCSRVPYFDFSESAQIPVLSESAVFPTTIPIVVPDNLYDQWIAATNWGTYASKIVKASEFVEPTTE